MFQELDNIEEMKILALNPALLNNPRSTNVQATWLGHASFLVQFDNITVLFDPVFSRNIGPIQVLGMKRYRECPCTVEELPPVDIVLVSHDHYDHLDLPTVKHLDERFGEKLRWCVPYGMKSWLLSTIKGKNITELNWWDEEVVSGSSEQSKVTVACVPAQHYGVRSLTDENVRS